MLHIPAWSAEPQIHGGARRTAQIEEWLKGQRGLDVARWLCTDLPPRYASGLGLRGAASARLALAAQQLTWRGRVKLLRASVALRAALHAHEPDVVVVESAPHTALVVALAVLHSGVPYVLMPHNVEALVPGNLGKDFRSRGAMLDIEGTLFASARAVLAISEFDQGVARLYTSRTQLLRYFPTQREAARFEAVRQRRADTAHQGVLVLGSASNAPSLDGLRHALAALLKQHPNWDEPIDVAGYRTELLLGHHWPAPVTVHGTISDAALDALLVRCRCAVLNQPFTSGGLTRLVELNLSGVPVMINGAYQQARGLNEHGIYGCAEMLDLRQFIARVQARDYRRYTPPDLKLADVCQA